MSTTRLEIVRRFFISLTIISLLLGSTTFAQEGEELIVPSLPPSPEAPEGTVNCFDYYKFGSVQADLSTVVSEVVPGIPMTFTGNLANNNPYPVVNGSLWVKIFRTDGQNESDTKANGYPLVAFFEAGKNIQIPGNGSLPYTFEWQVPLYIQGGDYSADFFFVTDDRFNLLGLSFTDDVTGNKTSFRISDTVNAQVTFDKHKVTLNKNRYNFAAFPPHFTKDEPVAIEVPVKNLSTEPRTVSLTWNLYNWDGLRSDFLLDTYTDVITLKPNETKTVAYTASKYTGTVSYVIATLDDQGATSIINPRFVRDDVEEVRLNFPSLMSFPLESGKEQTIFSCAHTTNIPLIDNNTITMTLKDLETNDVIHTYTYQGGITGAMMGVKDTFTPEKAYGKVSLTTELKHGDTLLDTVTQTYDCSALNIPCPQNATFTETVTRAFNQSPIFYLMVIVVSLGLLVYVLHINRRDKHVPGQYNTMPSKMDMKPPKVPPLSSLILVLVAAATFTIGVDETKGASIQSNVLNMPAISYLQTQGKPYYPYDNDTVPLETLLPVYSCPSTFWPMNQQCQITGYTPWNGSMGYWGIRPGANATINYQAILRDNDSGALIQNNAIVDRGKKIRIDRIENPSTDISWNGTGFTNDSPYGRWVKDAGPLPLACHPEDSLGFVFGAQNLASAGGVGNQAPSGRVLEVFALLNVKPVTPTYSGSNVSCVDNICEVTNTGTVRIQVTFPETHGRFYYRYIDARNEAFKLQWKPPCIAHNIPMNYSPIFPQATLTFTLTATNPNLPPKPPTIIPVAANNNYIGFDQSFIINGTDPDTATVKYEIDWNANDGVDTVNQTLPATGEVNSGTDQTATRRWGVPSSPTYTFKARTTAGGQSSGWTSHTITIITPLPPTVTTLNANNVAVTNLTMNGTVNPNNFDATAQFRWGTNNAGCAALPNVVNVPGTITGTIAQPISSAVTGLSAHTNYWYCAVGTNANGTTYGTVLTTRTLNTPPTATILTPGAAVSIARGNPVSFTGEGADADNDPITAYEWDTSCAPGGINLSTAQNFTLNTNTLPAGNHTIYFMVRDNQGTWSNTCDTVPLNIMTATLDAPSCTIPPGSNSCTSDITWSTQGVPSPSVRQDGTQFSTTANQPLPGTARTLTQGTHTFTILNGTTLLASDNAEAQCATGSQWDSTNNVCAGTPPGAPVLTFTATTPVPVGDPTTLTWTVTGPADACWARNNRGLNDWDGWKNVTGGTQNVTVTQNTTFYLECWNQGVTSGEKDAEVTTTIGSPADSTINANDCTIPTNQSTCNTLVTWDAVAIPTPSIRKNGTQFSTNPQSPTTGQVQTLNHGTNQFCISNGTGNVVCDNAVASCPASAPWDNTKCAGTTPVSTGPTLRANPRVVDQGDPTTLTWSTGGVNENECVLKGGAFGQLGITLVLDGDPFTGSVQTPVNGITTYTIICPAGGASDDVTVEVRDKGFET